jgi:hypothetical protein
MTSPPAAELTGGLDSLAGGSAAVTIAGIPFTGYAAARQAP